MAIGTMCVAFVCDAGRRCRREFVVDTRSRRTASTSGTYWSTTTTSWRRPVTDSSTPATRTWFAGTTPRYIPVSQSVRRVALICR